MKASIKLVETVTKATEVFRPLTRRFIQADDSKLDVYIDGACYEIGDEPIELKLNEYGKIAVVKLPLAVKSFEVRSI